MLQYPKELNQPVRDMEKELIRLRDAYWIQIEICNSENATDEDFTYLSQIKKDWDELSRNQAKLTAKIISTYKDGKQNAL